MALIFADGFDSYSATADLVSKFDYNSSATYNTFAATGGRFGGGALQCSRDDHFVDKVIPLTGGTPGTDDLFISFSLKMDSFALESYAGIMFLSQSSNMGGGSLTTIGDGLGIRVNAGVFQVLRAGSTVIATGSYVMSVDTWYRIEMQIATDNSSGVFKLKINETLDIDFTGDTHDAGQDGINVVKFGGQSVSANAYYDDIVIYSKDGVAPNDFLGDLRIETIRPNGAGANTDSTPSAGSSYECVDDSGMHDGDSTYVSLSTAADYDLYDVGALSFTPETVHAVVTNVVCRSDGTSPRTLRGKVKHGSTEGNGTTRDVPYGSDYRTLQDCFYQNPDTTSAWLAADIADLQIGQEVVA